jgi:transcriptional regulator with PAS, ATPase and Fis domain
MEKLALITGSIETAISLQHQLQVFLADTVQIDLYVSDEGISSEIDADYMVFSSQALFEEVSALNVLNPNKPYVIGNRTVNYDALDLIVSIPNQSKVLLVNDLRETAQEVKDALLEIGLDHIVFDLFYPGCTIDYTDYQIAITPGEMKHVPPVIPEIIDIGSRIFDFRTIARILSLLNLMEQSSGSFSKMYLEKIIKIAKGLSTSRNEIATLNENLNRVIESFNTGLIMYDKQFNIVVINDILKQILKVKRYAYVGTLLNKVIHNKKILMYLMDDANLENMDLTIDGSDYVASKFVIGDSNLTCVSFKSNNAHHMTKSIKEDAIRKGYVAKYSLDDIVGKSEAIKKLKDIILKLAKTDMNILIQGESGTGKELAASAIHNYSLRTDAPFLAVNFSALPDDLIESELFGYAEGAFTGAKKGGKTGLFEEANGGTIFLDEIGDVSLKVQSRLLRVLEEKEIMAIGSNEIKPIDVRIIAATNKDLMQLVNEKSFREDLYFRLKMGFIQLQPLRNRKDDIPVLVEHIANAMTVSNVEISEDLMDRLTQYDWMGNIRELKNTLNYMLAVRTGDCLTLDELPDENFFKVPVKENMIGTDRAELVEKTEKIEKTQMSVFLSDEQNYFFHMIINYLAEDKVVSRNSLSEESQNGRYKRTENQVRRILNQLQEKKIIEMSKGRKGIVLTELAHRIYER